MNKANIDYIEEFKENKQKFYGRGANPNFIAWNNIGNYFLKALEAKDAEIEEKVKEAFFSGFEESDEGMNGEYPFQDNNINPREDERIKKRFEKWKEDKLNPTKMMNNLDNIKWPCLHDKYVSAQFRRGSDYYKIRREDCIKTCEDCNQDISDLYLTFKPE